MAKAPALRFLLPIAALAVGSGCALTPPPIEDVLSTESPDDLDAQASRALAAHRKAPQDGALALEAAKRLFDAANGAVNNAFADNAEALDSPSVTELIDAEADVPPAIADRVLALAKAGADAAQVAVDASRDGPRTAPLHMDGQVYLALHLTFIAWANGPARSLMAGYGSRIAAAMDAALEVDPDWDHGAPLRLRGQFLCKAPWPVGDGDEGLALLRRATASAPTPIHHLFLGDALHKANEPQEAIAQWEKVRTATADPSTALAAPSHRRLAKARLDAASRAVRH